jgi:hypothetical protein
MLLAVEQQDRARPDDGAEEPVGIAHEHQLGVAGDHPLDRLRGREEDRALARPETG